MYKLPYLVDLIMNTPPNFDQQPIHYKIWDKMNNLAGTDSVARLFYALWDFIHHEIIHYEIVDCISGLEVIGGYADGVPSRTRHVG